MNTLRRALSTSALLSSIVVSVQVNAQTLDSGDPNQVSTTVVVDRSTGRIVPGALATTTAPPPIAENVVSENGTGDAGSQVANVTNATPIQTDGNIAIDALVPDTTAPVDVVVSPAPVDINTVEPTPVPVASEIPAIDQALPEPIVPETPTIEEVAADEPLPSFRPFLISPTDDPASLSSAISTMVSNPSLSIDEPTRQALISVYQARGFAPIFVNDPIGTESALRVLGSSDEHGLPLSRYELRSLSSNSGTLNEKAAFEVELAARVISYGRDQEKGIVLPRDLNDEFDYEPIAREHTAILQDYVGAANKAAFFQSLLPNDPAYMVLVDELARLRTLGGAGLNVQEVPLGDTLREGDYGPRVAILRQRLHAMGYESVAGEITGTVSNVADAILNDIEGDIASLPAASDADPQPAFDPARFDAGLAFAVRNYQTDAGLDVDGAVGPSTLTNINAGPEDKIQSLLIGLERHRWGPQYRDGRQIYVNIANFMAEVRDNNNKTFETRVVVGKNKAGWRTPEFNDQMTHLMINPKWYVPESISVKEYLPKIQNDASYLERNNITMKIRATGQVVRASQIDMSQFTVDDFPFLLVQGEGDDNALGDVKFMFPNKHNIYLHDTPSKNLFSRALRAFSHGCVRVAEPVELARVLLAPQFSDPAAAYNQYRAAGNEQQVDLSTPVPIHLTYFTAYMNGNGGVSYAPDSYGRDQLLRSHLQNAGVVF